MWEIAQHLGTSVRMVEKHYAHHHPDFMGKSKTAIRAAPRAVEGHRTTELGKRPSRKELLEERKANEAVETKATR